MANNPLFGPQALADEEEALRTALIRWAQHRLDEGARPISIWAALMNVADMMRTCDGFERATLVERMVKDHRPGWRGEADDSRARAALKQIIEISAGPIRRIAEEGLA